MKLLVEAMGKDAAPTASAPAGAPDNPAQAWPLLQTLDQPPAATEPQAGTLVRLFGNEPAPAPQVPPIVARGPVPSFMAPPPVAPAGPFGQVFGAPPQAPVPDPRATAAPPALVPAERVTTPLAEILQRLARGASIPASPFAALRLPGSTPGFR
ncbi:hypothetical protein [Paracraurococcus lichenis]|uniref:Uncharacterized protein n=1 Tax=Paracraurococcus lichenis TaxID=3064888 RepID=A0ABT9DW08_9PROT|nr:hypothetical protein [Paracraurococcus sp. LOR1-02]MDO9708077.1 hypothetical protein [Paracraurococcus sp. LOR1-02]